MPTKWSFFTMLTVVALFVLAGCTSTGTTNQGDSLSRDSGEWIRKVTQVYDAQGRFASLRAIRFDYVIRDQNYNELSRVRHLWDRVTGDYRYEADASQFAANTFFDEPSLTWKKVNLKLPAGALVAIVNVKTRQGKAYINGKEQPASLIKYVLDRVDNDSKWLTLPLQLSPPTKTQFVNTETRDGVLGVNLAVTTPDAQGSSKHDLWILTVNTKGEVLHTGIKSPGSFLALVGVWDMTQVVEGVTFITHRYLGERTIVYESIASSPAVDPAAFTATAPMLVTQTPTPFQPAK